MAAVIDGALLHGRFAPAPVATPLLPTVRLTVALPDGHELVSQRGRAEIFGQYSPLAISRDGRDIAFGARDASGTARLYLRAIDSLESRPLPGTENGELPFFSPDDPSFRPGTPEPLFEGDYVHQFDVFPDGEHFAMITFPDVALREIEVVANWSTELTKLIPADR